MARQSSYAIIDTSFRKLHYVKRQHKDDDMKHKFLYFGPVIILLISFLAPIPIPLTSRLLVTTLGALAAAIISIVSIVKVRGKAKVFNSIVLVLSLAVCLYYGYITVFSAAFSGLSGPGYSF